MLKMKDYYEILKVSRSASPEVIKAAYRVLCFQFHPDRNDSTQATERMQEINEAYETLSDKNLKEKYDRQLADSELDSWIKDLKFEENKACDDSEHDRKNDKRVVSPSVEEINQAQKDDQLDEPEDNLNESIFTFMGKFWFFCYACLILIYVLITLNLLYGRDSSTHSNTANQSLQRHASPSSKEQTENRDEKSLSPKTETLTPRENTREQLIRKQIF